MAGKTRLCKVKWASITSDRWILQSICGYRVNLDTTPYQKHLPRPIVFNASESALIEEEIRTFLHKKVIEKVPENTNSEGEFISNILMQYKKSGGIRIILNLKLFNQKYVEKIHFKMQTLKTAIDNMTKDCYFCTIDLQEAFFSIPVCN